MLKQIIALAIASLGVILLVRRKKELSHPNVESAKNADTGESASQAPDQTKDQGKGGDELDDSRAAEVVATWNLLNPP